MSNKPLNIGLFGFGVVGEGIYHVLQQTPSLQATIKKICIKDSLKKRNAPERCFTTDANELLNDKSINVIVELIDDADAAYHLVARALQNGKHVVSANKKMIAEHLSELLVLQQKHNVSLLYEAAVCGSVPVIRNLEEYYDNDLLHSVGGIVNGSTNYILTRMSEEKLDYAEALREAQEAGFAESNPILDVTGVDAANKLAILIKHAYGIDTSPENILRKGIDGLHAADFRFASENGYAIRLVAQASVNRENEVRAQVLPSFVTANNPLFNVRHEYNAVLIGSSFADQQLLYGKGAGRYPTASAVLSDIAALRYNYRYEYRKSEPPLNLLSTSFTLQIFLSCHTNTSVDTNAFTTIVASGTSESRQYYIGEITSEILRQTGWLSNDEISLIVANQECCDGKIANRNYLSPLVNRQPKLRLTTS